MEAYRGIIFQRLMVGGIMPFARKSYLGEVFGRMTVIGNAQDSHKRQKVICRCQCGNERVVDPRMLVSGRTKSCGCLHKAVVSNICKSRATHGMARTPEWNSWMGMRSRCRNEKDAKYKDYGGRGITVCDDWAESFESFLSDMGNKPKKGWSIDRVDVNGNYCKENCRWASPKQQARNKRCTIFVEVNGSRITLAEACESFQIDYKLARSRLKLGRPWMPLPPPPEG